ncbi:translation initiation factor IF-2-like isoform X2 [Silurus meridionalis]|uniref:translation initiation factor IF-2-like isoform X2 n=1 Tax=Silurus meridionalis TaxID=175797 RepID=UPI001EEA3EB9|nr:translation initiation factor IF-2-like isoform X2 [Silurus meridionalis]
MKTLCRDGATLHQHFNLIRSTRLRGTTTSRVHPHPAQVPAVEEKPAAAQVPAVEEKPAAAQDPAVEEKPAAAQVPAVEEKPAAAQVPAVEVKPAQVQNSVKAPSASVQPHAEGTYLDCATEEHTHTHTSTMQSEKAYRCGNYLRRFQAELDGDKKSALAFWSRSAHYIRSQTLLIFAHP